jgi:uncharacterized membrane protein YesL
VGPFRSFWRGFKSFEHYGYVFVIANIMAMVCALPLITAPAAFAGMCRLAHAARFGPTCHTDDYWSGFRDYFVRGLIISALTAAVAFIVVTNLQAFSLQSNPVFIPLRLVWISGLLLWIGVVLYLFPLLERMERPNLWLGIRNAALMMIKNPFFSIVVIFGLVLLMVLSTLLVVPWAMMTMAVVANISTAAVDDRLAASGVVSK